MLEQQRQAYLEAMGIPLWFPRYQLPNALQSPEYHWPEACQQQRVKSNPANTPFSHKIANSAQTNVSQHGELPNTESSFTGLPKVTRAQIRESLIDSNKEKQTESFTSDVVLESESMPGQLTDKLPAVKDPCFFQLVCMAPNEQVMLVTELPYSGANEASTLHYSLVNNLFSALRVKSSIKEARIFRWPFTHQLLIDQSESIARAAVKSYLDEQLGFANKKLVIFMGPTAVKYGLGLEVDFDSMRGVRQQGKQKVAVTHSLNEILQLPQYKKEAWSDLASLIQIDW